ncbi:protease inhibitor I9 family protein [Rossellomorea sp. BNER]|uniref:protease inhibitor I9 family protein n=1 Tax=Rossellomorea sp. BNER TaxID=2962031 RepID=UPI003AF24262|nr:protease inhibitor I9 family protein [Rossellomorea sp. BNER]
MKKCYYRTLLFAFIMTISGCQANKGEDTYPKEGKVVEETMNSSGIIDPSIDLSSNQKISVIIKFTIKPAKVAVLEAKAKGIDLTLEEAKQQVEESYQTFQKEIHTFLDENQVSYHIKHRYKTTFNGVSMELPANEIKRLMESSVIQKIYPNEDIQLDPPIQPSDQM